MVTLTCGYGYDGSLFITHDSHLSTYFSETAGWNTEKVKIVKVVCEFKRVIRMAVCSSTAWTEEAGKSTTSASPQLPQSCSVLVGLDSASHLPGLLILKGAHLCLVPLGLSSTKSLLPPTAPLPCAAGTRDTKHVDYFLALIYGTYIKMECF